MGQRERAALAWHRDVWYLDGHRDPVAIRVQRPRGVVIWLCRDAAHWHSRKDLAAKCSTRRMRL